ncbi:hypothetical protein CLTEP_24580 [Clostridium tepidiprofundi DSM 19306]|uniref:Uncharacterized protein n=1 Tax=Clostridium tepidiprofundi DSM 19306 TaxID=1121338 RepID=A0A151ATH5_9CLOT|nr:hypothetical protein [Clostridium tepidiprofundi]KYH30936.1 hypothetical protein CLTEP_24580 [Clostridium tepidiprofundi DSM 19306]
MSCKNLNEYDTGYDVSGKTAITKNDSNLTINAIGIKHYGINDIPNSPTSGQVEYYKTQALYSVLESLGSSPWDEGHYFSGTQTQTGQELINIVYDSGWKDSYNYIY